MDPRLARTSDPRRNATPQQLPPPPPPPKQGVATPEPQINGGVNGTNGGARIDDGGYKLKFSTVCASNQNRYESSIRSERCLT